MSFKRNSLLMLLFVVSLTLLAGCAGLPAPATPTTVPTPVPTPAPETGPYWPTQGWRSSTPEEQGMDSETLGGMLEAVEQEQLNLDALLVIRNGYVVSETYFKSGQDIKHELYSCTKSFVSTLIGIAIDQGKIDSIDRRIIDFFPQVTFDNLDALKQSMTLEDVLTMRSGLSWQEGDAAYNTLYRSQDWVRYMLDMPMATPPGILFNYCSGCSHLLSVIVHETTGVSSLDFAKQNLFGPLGITDFRWDTDSAGNPIGGWGLQLTPRDMAKLGYLFLRQGEWDGRQIVSAKWVEAATQKHTPTDGDLGYGYQWWTYPSLEGYTALGRYGQTIFVIPRLDLVIVTTAGMDNHDPIFDLIEQYIVPSVKTAS